VSFGPERHQALDRVYYRVVEGDRFVPLASWERWRK
jgi:branched-chain amino acid transport system substrate-binding protein